MVKSTCCSYRGLKLGSQQPPVTQAPRDPIPPSDRQSITQHMHAGKTVLKTVGVDAGGPGSSPQYQKEERRSGTLSSHDAPGQPRLQRQLPSLTLQLIIAGRVTGHSLNLTGALCF